MQQRLEQGLPSTPFEATPWGRSGHSGPAPRPSQPWALGIGLLRQGKFQSRNPTLARLELRPGFLEILNCFRKTRSLLVEALLQRGKLELRLLRFVAHQRCVELCGRFERGAYCIKSSLPFSLVWRQGQALQGGQRCGYPFGQIVRNRDVFPDGVLQVAGNQLVNLDRRLQRAVAPLQTQRRGYEIGRASCRERVCKYV